MFFQIIFGLLIFSPYGFPEKDWKYYEQCSRCIEQDRSYHAFYDTSGSSNNGYFSDDHTAYYNGLPTTKYSIELHHFS